MIQEGRYRIRQQRYYFRTIADQDKSRNENK
jgi:hypothetical protein